LLVEKYLNDTIATDRLALEDEITNRNLMPRYLVRLQFRADSIRAAEWARQTDDSSRWIKYQTPSFRYMMLDTSEGSRSPLLANLHKPSPYKSALAERMARLKAQAAAATIGLDTVVRASGSPVPGDTTHRSPAAARTKDTTGKPRQPPPRKTPDSSQLKDSTR
jgi:hypothetical protein